MPIIFAAAETDRFGNLIETRRLACTTYERTANQTKARIGDAVNAIAAWARQRAKPIPEAASAAIRDIEALDFAKKKAELESSPGGPRIGVRGKRRRSLRLSGFAYSKVSTGLRSAAFRRGVEIIVVNPAYTSTIGAVNHARRLGISVHCAAALAIARRGLGLAERPTVRLAISPVRNGGHVTFALASQGIAQSMCGRSGRTSGAVSRAAASSACPVRRSSAMSAAPAAHQAGIVRNLDLAW